MKTSGSLLIFLCLIILDIPINLRAADIKTDIQVVLMTKKKNGKTEHVKLNDKVIIKTISGKKVNGRIQEIKNEYIVVDNQEIKLMDIKFMRVFHLGKKVIGGLIGILGLFGITLGIILAFQALIAGGLAVILLILSIPLIVISSIILISSILICTSGKKFGSDNWVFSTASLSE